MGDVGGGRRGWDGGGWEGGCSVGRGGLRGQKYSMAQGASPISGMTGMGGTCPLLGSVVG